MELTDFLDAGTNLGKLKVDSMIFGQAWSKMTMVNFHETLESAYHKNQFMN